MKLVPLNILLQGITRNEIDFLQNVIADGEIYENEVIRRTNDFPQYLARLVEGSPIARACYRVLQNYVKGDGITVPTLNKLIVGCNNELLGNVFESVSSDFVLLDRFAILVEYEASENGYVISKFSHLPAEYLRYSIPSENGEVEYVVYNPYFNTTEAQLKTQYVVYPLFNPNRVNPEAFYEINAHNTNANYGQVIFFNLTTPINRTYSRPDVASCENAMIADNMIWQFHTANLKNNGFLGGIMNVYGDPDKPAYQLSNGLGSSVTIGEEFENKIRSLFSGAGNAGSILVNWLLNPTDAPAQFAPFQSNDNDSKFANLPEVIKETITTAFNVPSILANIQVSGKLGNTQEVELAIKQMNANIRSKQAILEAQFTYLLRVATGNIELEYKIVPISPILEIPQYIFQALTPEQQAEYIEKNYGIKQSTQNNANTNTPN